MKFDFDADFQNQTLSLLVHSTEFLKAARNLIEPDHFSSNEQWVMCSIIYDFFDKYGTAPKDMLKIELGQYLVKQNAAPETRELLLSLYESLTPNVTARDYIAAQIRRFARHEGVRKALEEFIPAYNSGDYDLDEFLKEVEAISKIDAQFDNPGTLYFENLDQRHRRRREHRIGRYVLTYIDRLDRRFGGLGCKHLGTVMGRSGYGKSFFLVHLGKAALLQGKTVFHYTLEMSDDEIEDRYDQMIVGETKEKFLVPDTFKRLSQRIAHLENRGGNLVVKYFDEPVQVSDITSHVETCRTSLELSPDMIIVDYGELLKSRTNFKGDTYLTQSEIWRDLKTLASKLDIPVWTATQANRWGLVADSYEKFRISHVFIEIHQNEIFDNKEQRWNEIINQSEAGKTVDDGKITLYVRKVRGEASNYFVEFYSDLDRGLFYSKRRTDIEFGKEDEEEEEDEEEV